VKNATLEGITAHYNRQFGSLQLQASGDWQNPQDDSSGKQLARRAKRHGAIGISQQWQKYAAGATLLGSSKRYNDAANSEVLAGYGLLNLNASYDIDKRLQLAAVLENTFDKQYELAKDYATPRRNLFVSLNYRY
jgi:vitamin B12 transporter